MNPAALLDEVVAIARSAGDRILEFYREDIEVDHKEDHSPVTVADHASDAIIVPALERLTPDIPVVSEERVERMGFSPDVSGGRFWLVDPLDGTREFINHRDEFTVNIGLIDDDVPVLGVVGVPAYDRIYAAALPGKALRFDGHEAPREFVARVPPADGHVVTASRSHRNKDELKAFLAAYTVAGEITAGSALKFCLVAEGAADLYPRLGPTMEWDSAAGHAIVLAAGGTVLTRDGKPLGYGKPDFRNPHFIVRGKG